MKRNGTSVGTKVALITILSVAVLLAGCSSPFGPDPDSEGAESDRGNLVISVGSGSGDVSTMTVFPTVELSLIKSYKIILTDGPGNDVVTVEKTDDGSFPSPLELRDIIPGTWNVKVEAYDGPDPDADSANLLLAGGKAGVEITAGETNSLSSITLSSIVCDGPACEGTLDLTVSWLKDQGVDEVYYRIKTFDEDLEHESTVTSFDGPDGEDRYSVKFPDSANDNHKFPAGLYWVSVRLGFDDTIEATSAWVVDELVYIRANLTSSETFKLNELEQQIEEEIAESIDSTVESEDDFESDEEFGYAYTGTGGGELTIDTTDINDDAIVSFKVRNENEATGNKEFATDDAEGRYDDGTDVAVSFSGSNDSYDTHTYHPPYPYDIDYEDGNTRELLPGTVSGDSNELSLQKLDDVIGNHPDLDLDGTVVIDGDYAGFLEGEFFLDASVDEILFEFGGGTNREYTFGDFTVSLP